MTCVSTHDAAGNVVIVCSRGTREKKCLVCGRIAVRQCDGPGRGKRKSCDAPLCARCTTSPRAGVDLCPEHRNFQPAEFQFDLFAPTERNSGHPVPAVAPGRDLARGDLSERPSDLAPPSRQQGNPPELAQAAAQAKTSASGDDAASGPEPIDSAPAASLLRPGPDWVCRVGGCKSTSARLVRVTGACLHIFRCRGCGSEHVFAKDDAS